MADFAEEIRQFKPLQIEEAIAQTLAAIGDLRGKLRVGQFAVDLGERGLPELHQVGHLRDMGSARAAQEP